MPNEQVNPGRPTTAAPSDFSTDPDTGITYIKGVPFSGDGSEGVAKEGVTLATAAALDACTYDNGTDGVGATLTGDTNGRLNVDGVDVSNGDRILVKDQSSSIQNGIYTVTEQGSGGAAFVLTRAIDFNASTDIQNGSTTICQNGDTNSGKTFYVSSASDPVIGTNAITFGETSGGGVSISKATGAEVDTGTDDAKYITPKALEDSDYIKEADLPASGGASNFYKGVDFVAFLNDLPAFTYDNGVVNGVGATITSDGNGALDADGNNPANNERVLIFSQSDFVAGIYKVAQAGDGSNPFILTRDTDFDTSEKIIKGAGFAILNGDRFADCIFYVSSESSPVIGTDVIGFHSSRVDGQVESIQAGPGISVDDTDPANPVVSLGAVPSGLFADLPGSPTIGNLFVVTDCPNNAWGDIVTVGGDTQTALIWFNGTNWTVIGGVPII